MLDHCPSKGSLDTYVVESRNYILCLPPSNSYHCGEGADTWTQVGHLEMTDSSQSCPSAWDIINTANVRGCGRRQTLGGSCDSVLYSTRGMQYSKVCGRIIAYQFGRPEGFIQRINLLYPWSISNTWIS